MSYLARVYAMTWVDRFMLCTLLLGFCAIVPQSGSAQTPAASRSADALPSAPQPQLAQNLRRFVACAEDQMGLVANFRWSGRGSGRFLLIPNRRPPR